MINGLSGAWGVITTFIFISMSTSVSVSLQDTVADSHPAFLVDRIGRRKPLIVYVDPSRCLSPLEYGG